MTYKQSVDLSSIIEDHRLSLGAGQNASLRYVAGLLGVSHETLRSWAEEGVNPSLQFLYERKNHVAKTHNFLARLIAVLTPESADLVVAEANES